jgi:hypothetical protein
MLLDAGQNSQSSHPPVPAIARRSRLEPLCENGSGLCETDTVPGADLLLSLCWGALFSRASDGHGNCHLNEYGREES